MTLETHLAPPAFADFTGEWIDAAEAEHLPSLRNGSGQGHVNSDLTSLSWLAFPPTTVGYHTGVLRVNGTPVATERYRWMPYGVQRVAHHDGLSIESSVRFATGRPAILWRSEFTNSSSETVEVAVDQEVAAMLADSEVDWGWLYGTPWNHGHYHDFFSTEKIRAEVLAEHPHETHLVAEGARRLRLGKPRIVGIQRDEDDVAMLLDTALPAHTTSDRDEPDLPGAAVVVRQVRATDARGVPVELLTEPKEVQADTDEAVGVVVLGDRSTLSIEFRLRDAQASGVIATHGNHPDSLQIGLDQGAPWISVGGEILRHSDVLDDGWHTITVTLSTAEAVSQLDDLAPLRTTPWWVSERWTCALEDGILAIEDGVTGAVAHYAFAARPDALRVDGSRGIASWTLTLAPGETRRLEHVLDLSSREWVRAADLANRFDVHFTEVQTWWESVWRSAFTPGNEEFSGYLPLLEASDDLERTYYLAALEALYMRNTEASPIGSIYLTGGPRLGPTTTFFWDIVLWGRVYALLDPASMRSWIIAALSSPYDQSLAFDCKNLLPIGNYYSANDYSLFRTVESYVGITGDVSVLEEDAAGRQVLEHLREIAFRPLEKKASFGEGVLVDFGDDPWELLEAVPNYRHVVVSFNAAYVGMLRGFAELMVRMGDGGEADRARGLADRMATAIVGQYAGDGRWRISMPDHDEVIGHCLDFQHVAAEMADDLTPAMRSEMVAFVRERLLDGDSMRALAKDDPIAPFSDRPDHGASGAFVAWPADTAHGLVLLGERQAAIDLLSRVHRGASGAVWGQAIEARGDGTYFASERGCHTREIACGASMADSILRGLFGIRAGFSALNAPEGSLASDDMRLHNVRAIGFDLAADTSPGLS